MTEYMRFPPKIKPRSPLEIAKSRFYIVYAAKELGQEPSGDSPGGVYAREGDKLIIRGFSEYDVENPEFVSHEDVTDSRFSANARELSTRRLPPAKMGGE